MHLTACQNDKWCICCSCMKMDDKVPLNRHAEKVTGRAHLSSLWLHKCPESRSFAYRSCSQTPPPGGGTPSYWRHSGFDETEVEGGKKGHFKSHFSVINTSESMQEVTFKVFLQTETCYFREFSGGLPDDQTWACSWFILLFPVLPPLCWKGGLPDLRFSDAELLWCGRKVCACMRCTDSVSSQRPSVCGKARRFTDCQVGVSIFPWFRVAVAVVTHTPGSSLYMPVCMRWED